MSHWGSELTTWRSIVLRLCSTEVTDGFKDWVSDLILLYQWNVNFRLPILYVVLIFQTFRNPCLVPNLLNGQDRDSELIGIVRQFCTHWNPLNQTSESLLFKRFYILSPFSYRILTLFLIFTVTPTYTDCTTDNVYSYLRVSLLNYT